MTDMPLTLLVQMVVDDEVVKDLEHQQDTFDRMRRAARRAMLDVLTNDLGLLTIQAPTS